MNDANQMPNPVEARPSGEQFVVPQQPVSVERRQFEEDLRSASQDLDIRNKENNWNERDIRAERRRALDLSAKIIYVREQTAQGDAAFIDNKTKKGLFGRLLTKNNVIPFPGVTTTRELLRKEARVGGKLFGAMPPGGTRQFFCLDQHSWVWHEEWLETNGQNRSLTTRFELRPNGILKAQGEQPYHYVAFEEEQNLLSAINLYHKHVLKDVYGVSGSGTGDTQQPLAAQPLDLAA